MTRERKRGTTDGEKQRERERERESEREIESERESEREGESERERSVIPPHSLGLQIKSTQTNTVILNAKSCFLFDVEILLMYLPSPAPH
jgi:hypothetical protein